MKNIIFIIIISLVLIIVTVLLFVTNSAAKRNNGEIKILIAQVEKLKFNLNKTIKKQEINSHRFKRRLVSTQHSAPRYRKKTSANLGRIE